MSEQSLRTIILWRPLRTFLKPLDCMHRLWKLRTPDYEKDLRLCGQRTAFTKLPIENGHMKGVNIFTTEDDSTCQNLLNRERLCMKTATNG